MSQSPTSWSNMRRISVPTFWRDIRVLKWAFQLVVLALVIALFAVLWRNLQESLRDLGLTLGFDFLNTRAGFHISEGLPFDPNETMLKAYGVGVVNTLYVSAVGIVLATLVGTLVGISRLSANWLVNRMALVFIELMQNIPLLVQLFFWYVLIRSLPAQQHGEIIQIPSRLVIGSLEIPPLMYISQRGAALPGIELTDSFESWWPVFVLSLIAAFAAWWIRGKLMEQRRRPPTGQFWAAITAVAAALGLGWVFLQSAPIRVVIPALTEKGLIVNYVGGWVISNSLQALLIGLVLYTAGFIAEAVRAGIQSVPHGQIEAATSLGLTRGQQLRLIVLPQALRVTIPPLMNQYLNLAKNSSLAIVVGYHDLYNVSQTIGNQSGQNVQIVLLMMGTYLVMSLFISLIMNIVNKRIQIRER